MDFFHNDQFLTICWEPECATNYWYVWLYDNTPENWHKNGQKLTVSSTVDINVRPINIYLTEESLHLDWPDKQVVYPIHWLKQYNQPSIVNQRIYWTKHDQHKLHAYDSILSTPSSLLACLKDIQIYGFTRIEGVPIESGAVLELVSLFGYVRETNYGRYYDVVAEASPENLANSSLGLTPHTDNPYRYPTPTIQLLHCLQANVEGGDTILVDGFNLAKKMEEEQPHLYQLLCSHPIKFRYETDDCLLEHTAPIFGLDARGELSQLRFNNRSVQPFELPDAVMLPYYKAYQYFERQLDLPINQLRFKLAPGQAIIYDNERILHGRTAFHSVTKRHLQGCYADRDALQSKIAVLERDLTAHEN